MLEGDLVNDLKKGLESSGAWYFQKVDNTARGTKKPCDAWVAWYGHAGGIEAKLHKGKSNAETLRRRGIPVLEGKDFREGQIPSLNRMRGRHVAPIIIIGVFDESVRTMLGVFALRVETFELHKLSMTLGDLEASTAVIKLERGTNGGWTIPKDKCQWLFSVVTES